MGHGPMMTQNVNSLDISSFYRTSFVLQYFSSIQQFSDNLKEYARQWSRREGVGYDLDGTNSGDSDNSDYEYVDEDDWEAWQEEEGECVEERKAHPSSSARGPSTPLSELFSVFRSCVQLEEDEEGRGDCPYFVGDLDEKRQLAEVLDNIKDLSFADKYTFCLAPVNVDNERVIKAFRSMAKQYARGEEVSLEWKKYDVRVVIAPRSPEDLLVLETMHQVYDLYLWLAMRFPQQFLDVEEMSRRSAFAASVIDRALQSMRVSSSQKKSTRTKKTKNDDLLNSKVYSLKSDESFLREWDGKRNTERRSKKVKKKAMKKSKEQRALRK